MNTVVLEAEWDADDIIEECERRGLICLVYPQDDLRDMKPEEFVNHKAFFCSTVIVQDHISKMGLASKVPDTYPAEFEGLYGRTVTQRKAHEITEFPVFIKPTGNRKDFEGRIVNAKADLPLPETDLYVSNPITFTSEYRLLVGGGRVYAQMSQKGDKTTTPDTDFVKKVLALSEDKFYCVDVGFIKENDKWAVVEVNPCFSLDDYGLDIKTYFDYCVDACDYILRDKNG